MTIGTYKIKYPAILKKEYEDGSIEYETAFNDDTDVMMSIYALQKCVNYITGTATDNPRLLIKVSRIDGEEAIIKELTNFEKESQNEVMIKMFDSGAFSDILKAYCKKAMQNCKIDDTIDRVMSEIKWLLDTEKASQIIKQTMRGGVGYV